MSYDCYVAICKPLHYGTLLGSRACVHMAAAAWATGFLNALLHTANTFSLPLCKGNALDQFFCEIPQILKLSCSNSYFREAGLILVSVCLGFGCFVFIVVSYVQILRAVLRIPSEQGRHKAFATCLPHLAVVSLFVSTAMFAYLKPPSISSPSLDLVVSVLYSVVPPFSGGWCVMGDVRDPLNATLLGPDVYEDVLEMSPVVWLNSLWAAVLSQDWLFKAQDSVVGSAVGHGVCFQPSGGGSTVVNTEL
ncbi:olfactory receptor 14J1-like [Caloenas nicobarica]|uniref:olfactory receptor 14J1-like n=1 Tax=Caloenas nicobarica TaxID=187106 RepID=UPI0032B853B9